MNSPPSLRSAAQLLQELRQYQEANTLYEDWALTTRTSGGTASFVPPRPELPGGLALLLGLRPFQRPSEKQLAWLEQTLGEAVVRETIQPAKMAGSSTQSVSDLLPPSLEARSGTSTAADLDAKLELGNGLTNSSKRGASFVSVFAWAKRRTTCEIDSLSFSRT